MEIYQIILLSIRMEIVLHIKTLKWNQNFAQLLVGASNTIRSASILNDRERNPLVFYEITICREHASAWILFSWAAPTPTEQHQRFSFSSLIFHFWQDVPDGCNIR